MNCGAWEEPIALWVEGDLPSAAALEAHLAFCASCRAFAAELRGSQAVVKSLPQVELDCARWHTSLALHVEGDLPDPVLVEAHLRGCAACHEFLEELRATQALVKSLPRAVPRARRRAWPWWAAGAAAAAAALLFALLRPLPPVAPLPERTAWTPPTSTVTRPAPGRPPAPRRVPVKRIAPPAAPRETEFIRMMTDDENIVILWVADLKGELQ
jgi:hypothetical protein